MLPIARTRQKSKITVLVSARRWVQQFAPYSLAVLFVPTTVFEPLKSIALFVAESPCGALTFLETQFGKPFTANGFGNWFRRRCNEAGLPHCSAHGLRKAGATIAADNGATSHQLMAIFGWKTIKQAEIYTQWAKLKF